MSKTRVLTSVVAAAVVTLVISLSVVLGLWATRIPLRPHANANATGEQVREGVPSAAKVAQAAPKLAPRPAAPKPAPAAPAPPARSRGASHRRRLRCACAQTMVAAAAPASRRSGARIYALPRRRMFRPRPLCSARAGPGIRSAATASPGGAAGTASARQDHRTHSDHQPVPRTAISIPDSVAHSRCTFAADERFTRVVQRGVTTAAAELAHSVHVELAGLRSGALDVTPSGARNADSPSVFASRRPSAIHDRRRRGPPHRRHAESPGRCACGRDTARHCSAGRPRGRR